MRKILSFLTLCTLAFLWPASSQAEGGQSAQSRDTDDKISDTQIHSITEVNIGGTWTKVAEATCTKG